MVLDSHPLRFEPFPHSSWSVFQDHPRYPLASSYLKYWGEGVKERGRGEGVKEGGGEIGGGTVASSSDVSFTTKLGSHFAGQLIPITTKSIVDTNSQRCFSFEA